MSPAARPRLPRSVLDIAELLGTVPLFARLSLQQRELVARTATHRKFRRGELVMAQGAPGDALFVVARGSVLIHRSARGGRRATAVVEAPGAVGEITLIDGRRRSASVEALEDTDVFSVPRADFLRLLADHPELVQAVLAQLGQMVRRLTDQLSDDTLLDIGGRVAKTLLRLVEARREVARDALPVVTLSQGKLAELVGGSRQSVNAALSALASRGLVRLEGRRIMVTDLAGLRLRAGIAPAATPAAGAGLRNPAPSRSPARPRR